MQRGGVTKVEEGEEGRKCSHSIGKVLSAQRNEAQEEITIGVILHRTQIV